MHATTDVQEERINWPLGLKALLAAISLAGISAGSGSQLPMMAAVLIAGWAMVKPLRLMSWVLSPGLIRAGGNVMARVAAVMVAAFVLSVAINSNTPVLTTIGGVLFIGLLGVVAAVAARWALEAGLRWTPRIWAWGGGYVAGARTQASVVWGSMIGR